MRWPPQHFELLRRLGDLTRQHRGLPDEPGIARLDGFIALMIKTPIAVEGKAFKPVPLSERIGKAGVYAAGRINANQISTIAGIEDGRNGLSPIGETILPLLHGGVHRGGIEKMWILGEMRQLPAQFRQQLANAGVVAV